MKRRPRFSNALQEVRADKRADFIPNLAFTPTRSLGYPHVTHQSNPSNQAICETADCRRRARATIRRSVRVSTTIYRQSARIDSDKVAPVCNEAAHRERDCLQSTIRCHDHCAEVSRQNAVSTGTRKVTTSPRTRFANLFAVDTAQQMAAADSDHRAWL